MKNYSTFINEGMKMKNYSTFINEGMNYNAVRQDLMNGQKFHFGLDYNVSTMYMELVTHIKDILIGRRVEVVRMNDEYPVPAGTQGTIDFIDDIDNIHVKWDNGSKLAYYRSLLIPGNDRFIILANEPEPDPEVIIEDYESENMFDEEDKTNWLNDYGQLEWRLKTNAKILTSRAYYWVNRVILLDETEGRRVIGTTKISDMELDKWEPVKPEEKDEKVTIE